MKRTRTGMSVRCHSTRLPQGRHEYCFPHECTTYRLRPSSYARAPPSRPAISRNSSLICAISSTTSSRNASSARLVAAGMGIQYRPCGGCMSSPRLARSHLALSHAAASARATTCECSHSTRSRR